MTTINRRAWLKTSIGVASAVAFTPAFADRLKDMPVSDAEKKFFDALPPTIKIRLGSNENPYGPSEKARKAIVQSLTEANRYTFGALNEMKELLARHEGVTPDHILIGAGSGELLCCTGAAFGVQGGNIVAPYPTFPMLMNFAEVFAAKWEKVLVNDRLEVDYSQLASRITPETKLVFVCNPNNPTGTLVDNNTVMSFCEEVSKTVPVFADEAYLEFLEPENQVSMVSLVKKGSNVIVSKTFSKIYGLAGLRIGYLIANPDTIKKIARYQSGISVNQTALAAAKASVGDKEFMAMSRKKNTAARKILTDYLDKKNYSYGKSFTNFVFLDSGKDAQALMNTLAEKGIGIRVWELRGKLWNRISIGTSEEMQTLVKTLDEIV